MNARDRLLDVSLQVMAERGIDGVPLQEIITQAGQRNASAVHYYFGSRAGLVDEVARRHQATVDDTRRALLDAALQRDELTIADLSACIVLPVAAMMGTRAGRDGVRVVSQVIRKYGFHTVLTAEGAGREALQDTIMVLERALQPLPPAVRRQRIAFASASQVASWADRAIQLDAGREVALTHQQFLAESIAWTSAVLQAPVVDMRTLRWATSAT